MTRRFTLAALIVLAGVALFALMTGPAEHRPLSPLDPPGSSPASPLANRLKAHVDYLASPQLQGRKPGTPGHRLAAQYVANEFRALGLDPLHSFSGYGQTVSPTLGDNLIGMRRPSGAAVPRWILLGAHYDHLGDHYLGADDNASAVAILLETARALPTLQRHPILFVAFNTEEAPYIRTGQMGSQHFVDHLPPEIGSPSNLHAVIIMDLMGGKHWAPLDRTVFAAGAEMSPDLYRRIREVSAGSARGEAHREVEGLTVRPVGLHLVEEIPLVGRVPFSDYHAFRNASVPFLFLSAGRTPRYHKPTDLPDTLHYERMAATVDWLTKLIQAIDEDGAGYTFEPTRIEFADEVATFKPLVTLAADPATGIPGTSGASLWKLKQDRDWLLQLDPTKATTEDIKRLERLSIRMQCLLADFPGCFLI